VAERLDLFPDEHLPFDFAPLLMPLFPADDPLVTPIRFAPAGGDQDLVIAGLVEIVEAKGPIRCNQLYRLYVEGSGDATVAAAKKMLNRAAHQAVRSGRLAQVEPLGRGQIDKTVHLPGTPAVVVRPLGDRLVSELPVSEIAERIARVREQHPGLPQDEMIALLGEDLGVELGTTDFWVLTFLVNAAV